MATNYQSETHRPKSAVTLAKVSLPQERNLPQHTDLRTPKDATPEERVHYSKMRLSSYGASSKASVPGRASPVDVPLTALIPNMRSIAKRPAVKQPIKLSTVRPSAEVVTLPVPPSLGELDYLKGRGVLSMEQYWAAQIFQRSVVAGQDADLRIVYHALPRANHSMMNWLKRNATTGELIDRAASYIFSQGKNAKTSRSREVKRRKFFALLRETLNLLDHLYSVEFAEKLHAA